MSGETPETTSVWSLLRTFGRAFSRRYKQCENARFLLWEVPLAAAEAQRVLPFGVRLSDPPAGTFFVVDYTRPTFTFPYHEATLLIHVRTLLGEGVHPCWMTVDDDTPMIYGRETLAYPKKMAQFTFREDGDGVATSVTRRGTELLAFSGRRGAPLPSPPPIFGRKTFNVGGIGQLLGINTIWLSRLYETVRESTELVDVKLRLQDSPYDPFARLVAGDPIRPRMVVTDIAGARYLAPVGVTGPVWFSRTFFLRYR